MKESQILMWVVTVSLLFTSPVLGQQERRVAEPESPVASSLPAKGEQAAVPRLVKFSGVLLDVSGKPLSGEVEVTFALYKQEADEEPLWTETQRVTADERGSYTVLLGATQATGIPADLFRSDDARWLGVQVQGQAQQPRTALVSVPYALKAVEAEKLAGKSASDFVLSENLGEQVRQVIQAQSGSATTASLPGSGLQGQPSTTTTAVPQATPVGPLLPPSTFSGTNSSQILLVQQNGTGNGVFAQTASSAGGSALLGFATSNSTSNSIFQNGVLGLNAGTGSGVAGIAFNPSAGVGVYGQSANFAGVFGNSLVRSGFTNGVFGQTASTNGNGVFGNATATSGYANGVLGGTASTDASGVSGFASASSGFNSGVFGVSSSINGTGVFGTSVQWVGVGGQATAPSGGPAFGVWGDSLSTGGTGVAGFEDATSGYTNGVYGQNASPNGAGVFGSAVATSGNSDGVVGQTANDGNGVAGFATETSGFASGVYGQTASPGGNGVVGSALSTSGNAGGVVGLTSAPNGAFAVWGAYGFSPTPGGGVGVKGSIEAGAANGVAGQFINVPGQGLLLQGVSGNTFQQVFSVDTSGNLQMSGNLVVNGTKSSTAKLADGRVVALYAVESPENWFEDFGSGELQNGVAWVPLDGAFAQAVNAAVTYHVFLTANGDSSGLFVARKTPAGFEVREHGGGTSNLAFDYRIVARRRGFETLRMTEVHEDSKLLELTRQRLREPASAEILKRAVPPRVAPIAPAIRPIPPRPVVPQAPKLSVPQPPKPR
jgi:hypothetical protein